ncbi:MAG: SEC-C domain-containing protein, partial [Clostridia bacterium]|nr:SEC-C domain-containing protein [Clostridia bacterium]
WVNHIDTMEQLKMELSTREDPINTYRKEGSQMFEEMTMGIRETTAKFLINAHFSVVNKTETTKPAIVISQTNAPKTVTKEKTVGRNEPCICGSGRKYKNCCGKNK